MAKYLLYICMFMLLAACAPATLEPAASDAQTDLAFTAATLPATRAIATATPLPYPVPTQTQTAVPYPLPSATAPNAASDEQTAASITFGTPYPDFYYYVSERHGLYFQYPNHWQIEPTLNPYLTGSDGFIELLATSSQDNLLENACADANFNQESLTWMDVAGQPACLISPANAGPESRQTLIVTFPQIMTTIVPDTPYAFLVLQADAAHMPLFMATLTFLSSGTATPAPTPTPDTSGCVYPLFFDASRLPPIQQDCPLQAPVLVTGAEQLFEYGRMLWLPSHPFSPDMGAAIVALPADGLGWPLYPDLWQPGEAESDPAWGEPPAGLVLPIRGFGKLWATVLRDSFGWATTPETAVTLQWQIIPHATGDVLLLGDSDGRVLLMQQGANSQWYYLP